MRTESLRRVVGMGLLGVVGIFSISSCTSNEPDNEARPTRVTAANADAAGEYLVRICGCNDCHTPGYSQSGGKVPIQLWLTGSPVGYRGPWGTTYASNLRQYVAPMSEDDWVRVIRARNDKSLHAMDDADLRAVYFFIKSLGPGGSVSPLDVPPGQEPNTPYELLAPPFMPTQK